MTIEQIKVVYDALIKTDIDALEWILYCNSEAQSRDKAYAEYMQQLMTEALKAKRITFDV